MLKTARKVVIMINRRTVPTIDWRIVEDINRLKNLEFKHDAINRALNIIERFLKAATTWVLYHLMTDSSGLKQLSILRKMLMVIEFDILGRNILDKFRELEKMRPTVNRLKMYEKAIYLYHLSGELYSLTQEILKDTA